MNNKGSALIWVVSTLLIFMIIVAGIFFLVGSSHRSALYNNYKQQAYFTALSTVDIVSAGIMQTTPPGLTGPSVTGPVGLNLPPAMGTVTAKIMDDVKVTGRTCIIIKAEADYLGVKDTVSLRMYSEGNEWKILEYGR